MRSVINIILCQTASNAASDVPKVYNNNLLYSYRSIGNI